MLWRNLKRAVLCHRTHAPNTNTRGSSSVQCIIKAKAQQHSLHAREHRISPPPPARAILFNAETRACSDQDCPEVCGHTRVRVEPGTGPKRLTLDGGVEPRHAINAT